MPPGLAPFTPKERALIRRLDTPAKVQAWLDGLPYNWERSGPTARGLRGVLRAKRAHCLEAALCAATMLEVHGYAPLLLDITSKDRLDHVLFVYQEKQGGERGEADDADGTHRKASGPTSWGSIARSRCAGLHGRDPVFASLDELVASYMAPFIDTTGRVTGYGILDLRTLPTGAWRTTTRNLRHIEDKLNDHRHKRLKTPDDTYRVWKRRFDTWWLQNDRPEHGWPPVQWYAADEDVSAWTGPHRRTRRDD